VGSDWCILSYRGTCPFSATVLDLLGTSLVQGLLYQVCGWSSFFLNKLEWKLPVLLPVNLTFLYLSSNLTASFCFFRFFFSSFASDSLAAFISSGRPYLWASLSASRSFFLREGFLFFFLMLFLWNSPNLSLFLGSSVFFESRYRLLNSLSSSEKSSSSSTSPISSSSLEFFLAFPILTIN